MSPKPPHHTRNGTQVFRPSDRAFRVGFVQLPWSAGDHSGRTAARFRLPLSVRRLQHFSDGSCVVRNMCHILDMTTLAQETDLRSRLLARVAASPDEVWTPGDFADLGGRAAVDKTLQRLATAGDLRRIDRGLYDRPRKNDLTGCRTVPDYRAVIRAVTRRDQARAVIDGMTAANELGFTTAVPARIEVLVDARLKPIRFGNQEIHFRFAAPSRLYWAGRPAMRVVQATALDAGHAVPGERTPARPRNAAPPVYRSPARADDPRRSTRRVFRPADLDAGIPFATCSEPPMRMRRCDDDRRIWPRHRRATA